MPIAFRVFYVFFMLPSVLLLNVCIDIFEDIRNGETGHAFTSGGREIAILTDWRAQYQ